MEKDIKEKKAIKRLLAWSGVTGGTISAITSSFIVVNSFIQKNKENINTQKQEVEATLEKKGRNLYKKYKAENNDIIKSIYQFYEKAGMTIYEEKLAVITPGAIGYLTINEDGIFKWVSFDGIIYDTPEELYGDSAIRKIDENQKKEAIESIMGIEKQTSFTIENLTLLSEVKEDNLYQTIYQNSKNLTEIKKVAEGSLYQNPYGYISIYTSMDGSIKADNLFAFNVLYENKDLYISQQTQHQIEKATKI